MKMESVISVVQSAKALRIDNNYAGCTDLVRQGPVRRAQTDLNHAYRQTCQIRRTQPQKVYVSRFDLQLSLFSPLKLGVKSRMKL